ncbi:MAG: NAD(P)-dependent oxidoreductase [Proteobacteria bacterium]|nr:NAD(P)-dependent oxidoreductase [Pseudomonadota bacterium]
MTPIGIIGLGQIGLPMAQNLIKAGYQVVGRRRREPRELIEAGGIAARSAREVAERCPIILSCLTDGTALADVVSGADGLADGDCDGRILVELTTADTELKRAQARALEARGGRMLDGAVSGIPRMVRERQGVVFVSGDEEAFAAVRAVLDAVSAKVFFMGPFGNALKAKLCANLLVTLHIAAAAEALALGSKIGVDPHRLIDALKDGAGASLQFNARAASMADGDWQVVRGSTAMLAKDIHLIAAAGKQARCPTPLLDAAAAIYAEAMRDGYADLDVASIYAVVARRAGLPIPKKA